MFFYAAVVHLALVRHVTHAFDITKAERHASR